jgi:hypothetical protein
MSQFVIHRFQEECNGYISLFKQIVVDEKNTPYEKRVSHCKEILANIGKTLKKLSKESPPYYSPDVVKILDDAKLSLDHLSKVKEEHGGDSLELFMRDLGSKLEKAGIFLRPGINPHRLYKNQKKPEGYGDQSYTTALEKREAQDQYEVAVNDAVEKANHKLHELEEQARIRQAPLSNEELLNIFRDDIEGRLSLARKAVLTALMNMKDQASRTRILKESQSPSPLEKVQPALQKSKGRVKELLGRGKSSFSDQK